MVGDQEILDGGSCANVMTQIAHLGASALIHELLMMVLAPKSSRV